MPEPLLIAAEILWPDGERTSPLPWPPDYEPTEWVREVVGSNFRGSLWGTHETISVIYNCVAYDPRIGFWMLQTNPAEGEAPRLTNVSERAIGRTFHRVYKPEAL